MKFVSLFCALFAFAGLSTATHATEKTACEPLVAISCQAWPRQAQMIGTVVSVQSFSVSDQELCKVTVKPIRWDVHALCPLRLGQQTVSYDVCGACPDVGSGVSGVVMSDEKGLVILD